MTSGLDGKFRDYWPETATEFLTLNNEEASPGTPFPYCIFSIEPTSIRTRMSGLTPTSKREHREIACRFLIHAQQTASRSAKEMAALMADEVASIFGGHATIAPTEIPNVFQTTLTSNQGIRTETTNYSWVLNYTFETDNVVAY
jgi:hypothetical protein